MLKKFLLTCVVCCCLFGVSFGCSSPADPVIDAANKDLIVDDGGESPYSPHKGGVQVK